MTEHDNSKDPVKDPLNLAEAWVGDRTEPTDEEKQAVRVAFDGIAEGLHTRFLDYVSHNEDSDASMGLYGADLILNLPNEDASRVSIVVRSESAQEGVYTEESGLGKQMYEIQISQYDKDNVEGMEYQYKIDPQSGAVLRFDVDHKLIDPISLKASQETHRAVREHVRLFSEGKVDTLLPRDAMKKWAESFKIQEANTQLEVDMGLNGQPVSLEEMKKLRKFFEQAHFEPIKPLY